MRGWTWQRLRAVSLAFGVLVLATGCGGGGGGDTDDPGAGIPVPPPTGQIGTVAWVQSSVRLERDVFDSTGPLAPTASLSIQANGAGYWFRYYHDTSLTSLGYSFRTADDGIDFNISFQVFPQPAPGSYTDTLSVILCHDELCTKQVQGSPFQLPLRLDVGYFAKPEEGVTPLAPAQTTVLNHDVVGAAYSAALDAVVTVSVLPEPLLRVHDLRSGLTRSYTLLTTPTSLALGADGLQAAVGHDAAVSLVNLREGAASPVRRMAVPLQVGSVLLAGTRIVAIGAEAFGWNSIYWVDTDSETAARAGTTAIYGRGGSVLHASGGRIYLGNAGVSPGDVSRMDLTGEAASAEIHDSRYHGEYEICSRMALSPDGRRLYTSCGVVLSTASLLDDDMVYAGRMDLSPRAPAGLGRYTAVALSVTPDNTAVALLEENDATCDPRVELLDRCFTRLAVYDATTLARRSLLGLAPFERGNDRLQQWGRRLMHRDDGSLIVIAEVRTRGEATPTWLLHRINP